MEVQQISTFVKEEVLNRRQISLFYHADERAEKTLTYLSVTYMHH